MRGGCIPGYSQVYYTGIRIVYPGDHTAVLLVLVYFVSSPCPRYGMRPELKGLGMYKLEYEKKVDPKKVAIRGSSSIRIHPRGAVAPPRTCAHVRTCARFQTKSPIPCARFQIKYRAQPRPCVVNAKTCPGGPHLLQLPRARWDRIRCPGAPPSHRAIRRLKCHLASVSEIARSECGVLL